WLISLLEQAAASFGRSERMTQLEADAYLTAWANLAKRVGRVRFEKALHRAVAECEFFPNMPQIESRVPNDVKLVGQSDASCPECRGTSFRLVNIAERRYGRCGCWATVECGVPQ